MGIIIGDYCLLRNMKTFSIQGSRNGRAYPQHDLDMSTFTVTNKVLIGMNRIVGNNNNKLKAISEPIN